MEKREVVAWISYRKAETAHYQVDVGGWGGMMTAEMRWADYIADIDPGYAAHHEALRAAILARGLRRGGDWHQNAPDGLAVFDDGAIGTFTFRAWGDLMAAVWSGVDGRGYGYMDFYMDGCVTDAGLALSPCP